MVIIDLSRGLCEQEQGSGSIYHVWPLQNSIGNLDAIAETASMKLASQKIQCYVDEVKPATHATSTLESLKVGPQTRNAPPSN